MSSTIVITGANRGIGLELARRSKLRGARVIATARRPSEARELAALGLRVEPLDVADAASVERFARSLKDVPIDLLVNNAGIGGDEGSLSELDPESLLAYFRVNTLGPIRVTRALLPNLRSGRAKKVVHITSRMGSIADNASGGYYGYRASKAALNMLNKCMALELGPEGFTCAVLHPGWVSTDMGGPEAPLSPAESAAGLLRVIDSLAPARNGIFLDQDGEEIPW